jgi:hypothetical protein
MEHHQQSQQVARWLTRRVPQLGAVYEGALRIISDENFPGRVHFAWHAVREIVNRLPDTFAEEIIRKRTEYPDLSEEICQRWKEDGWPEDGQFPMTEDNEAPSEGPRRFEISETLLVATGALVTGHRAVEERMRDKALRMFESISIGEVPDYAVSTWVKAGRAAVKLAHVPAKPLDVKHSDSLASDFARFEDILIALANPSYENMDDLDDLLASANG